MTYTIFTIRQLKGKWKDKLSIIDLCYIWWSVLQFISFNSGCKYKSDWSGKTNCGYRKSLFHV